VLDAVESRAGAAIKFIAIENTCFTVSRRLRTHQ
jgi:hypothetical protein